MAACAVADRDAVERLLAVNPGQAARLATARPELLIEAAARGQGETIRLLVELGFDVNARRRTTALHEAAWHGDVVLARLLLELGADPTVTDASFDATPLRWAEHGGQDEVAAYLRSLAPS
ncbi:hypothetical protein BH23ACT9_BH23ACT9_00090 [soil metagenome]